MSYVNRARPDYVYRRQKIGVEIQSCGPNFWSTKKSAAYPIVLDAITDLIVCAKSSLLKYLNDII